MNRHRFSLSMFLCASALAALATAAPSHAQIQWRKTYTKARQEAAKKELPLMLQFTTNPCPWCDKLEEETFGDGRVKKTINREFIPIKLYAENEQRLTSHLRIQSFPTVVFASSDGKILKTIVGFKNADQFHEICQRVLASVSSPEWMRRDYQLALKWITDQQYARAITALQSIIEDGEKRTIQVKSKTKLSELEDLANNRIATAKTQAAKGERVQAILSLSKTMQDFPGLDATKTAATVLTDIANQGGPVIPNVTTAENSKQRAKELLSEASKYLKREEYNCCLDRCETLIKNYGNLPEAQKAAEIASQIKANHAWLQNACDQLSDRLGNWYLELAESYLARNQAQQAIPYLHRIIRAFPESRHAQIAEIRLNQLQSQTMTPVKFRMP